jgi:tetratricopeptide (TPR) repeat protein
MGHKSQLFFFLALASAAIALAPSLALASQQQTDAEAQARVFLNNGIQAYKNAHFDEAIEDFKHAKQLDPSLTNASLFLATAYASQFIPGAPAEDNLEKARLAFEEYKNVLDKDPANLTAIDGAGGILYNMAGHPFDPEKMKESKTYHQRHIEIRPNDPEPYYWIGVIDWAMAYKAEQAIREELSKSIPNPPAPADPLPEMARQDFESKSGKDVDEGMEQLKKAISLKPDYDDAMAYLNLLYRLKADMESSPDARKFDIKTAEDLVDQVKSLKEKRMGIQTPQ